MAAPEASPKILDNTAKRCRRCCASLSAVSAVAVRTGWGEQEERPKTVPAQRCPVCTWVNLGPVLESSLHLRRMLEALSDEFPNIQEFAVDTDDPTGARHSLGAVGSLLFGRLHAEVERAPRAACAWVMALLGNLYDGDASTGFHGDPALMLQLVYVLHLVTSGPLAVRDHVSAAEWPPFWRDRAAQIAHAYVRLSAFRREADLGLPVRVVGGVAKAHLTGLDVWATEINANLAAAGAAIESHVDTFNDPLLATTERAAFGLALSDVLKLLGDSDALGRLTRVMQSQDGELTIIDLHEASGVIATIAARFMLTLERLHRAAVPAFFGADTRVVERNEAEMIDQARTIDWLLYFPLLSGTYIEQGRRMPAAITSRYLLHRLRGRAGSSAAYRVRTAVSYSEVRKDRELTKQVRSLERAFHGRFEAAVGAVLEEQGLTTEVGIEGNNGRRLACGEIDVLASCAHLSGRPLVFVLEAKNTDVSFYKDIGVQHVHSTMLRAREQASRKAAWVREHWREVPMLHGRIDAAPLVLALTVSRFAPAPVGGPGPATIALHELGSVVSAVRREPVARWRPDLRAALADPAL